VSCGDSIIYLGWDPVMGGDYCGHGGALLSSTQSGDYLVIEAQPLQWNPSWDQCNCVTLPCGANGIPAQVILSFQFRFITPNSMEIVTEINSQESISHPITGQEFPCLYVSFGEFNTPDLNVLLDPLGNQIQMNTLYSNGAYGYFNTTLPWATYQNGQRAYGIGIMSDQGILDWVGSRGNVSTQPLNYNYVRQLSNFGIDAGSTIFGKVYLSLGDFNTVASEFQYILSQRPAFGHVDVPAEGSITQYTPGQNISIAGWILHPLSGSQAQILIDGQPVCTIALNAQRPDVCTVYPMYSGCPQVGFAGEISTTNLSNCQHLVQINSIAPNSKVAMLAQRVISPN